MGSEKVSGAETRPTSLDDTWRGSPDRPAAGERQLLAGRYEILALLGAGSMGTVYRARDLELDEVVALKVLRRDLVDSPASLELFRREVRLSRRVTHRNVARVFDIGEHEGERLLTMELVEGESLGQALAREGAFAVPRALAVALAIAEGLGGAHEAGVVHRDLKPDNVLLARDGRVVITDFGVARAIAGAGGAGQTFNGLVGTPAYMAPEQIEGRPDVDARADIYALGALISELLTGKRVWGGASPFVPERLEGPAPDPRAGKPGLPAALAELVMRCLACKREQRPATIAEVAGDLAALAASCDAGAATDLPPSHRRTSEPALPADTDKTIAVLSFRNAGPAEDDYLASELTDDLIDALSMTHGLRVRARSTLLRFRDTGTALDAREIGAEVGVEAILEGSVRRAPGVVRMTLRLIGVADGFQLWAKRFERAERDVLAINDEAARSIAQALGVSERTSVRAPPTDPRVVDLYLRGRYEYRKFWPDSLRRGLALLQEALALSPDDPSLLAAVAGALSRLSFYDEGSLDAARAAAERAVTAAPEAGEPYLALGSVLFQTGDCPGAVRALREAAHLAPGLAEAHSALGRLLTEIGAVDEGIRRIEAALQLDPEVQLAHSELSRAAALLGRWEESAAHGEQLLRQSMFGFWLLETRLVLWQQRSYRGVPYVASAEYREALGREGGKLADAPRQVLAVLTDGRLPEGAVDLRELAQTHRNGVRGRLYLLQMAAEVHGFLGDRERVLAAIEDAAASGLIDRLWLESCPLLADVRADPRYRSAHAEVVRYTDSILAAYRAP